MYFACLDSAVNVLVADVIRLDAEGLIHWMLPASLLAGNGYRTAPGTCPLVTRELLSMAFSDE